MELDLEKKRILERISREKVFYIRSRMRMRVFFMLREVRRSVLGP